MKKGMIFLGCVVMLLSCTPSKKQVVEWEVSTDSTEVMMRDSLSADTGYAKSLNDIRFDGWTEKEWLDNEYIRTLRKHLDAYHRGEVSDKSLDEYKEVIKGQFVIVNIEPYLLGGAFIQFSFIDTPDKLFSVCVYSEVDEKTETVSNYECRGIRMEDYELEFTKEEILQIVSEHPELKLW